jgi:hypothetical protein
MQKYEKTACATPAISKKTSHTPISAITFSDRKQALLSKLFTPKSEVL